jgi:hypothetical protein
MPASVHLLPNRIGKTSGAINAMELTRGIVNMANLRVVDKYRCSKSLGLSLKSFAASPKYAVARDADINDVGRANMV